MDVICLTGEIAKSEGNRGHTVILTSNASPSPTSFRNKQGKLSRSSFSAKSTSSPAQRSPYERRQLSTSDNYIDRDAEHQVAERRNNKDPKGDHLVLEALPFG
jgi:hypothetical protein